MKYRFDMVRRKYRFAVRLDQPRLAQPGRSIFREKGYQSIEVNSRRKMSSLWLCLRDPSSFSCIGRGPDHSAQGWRSLRFIGPLPVSKYHLNTKSESIRPVSQCKMRM